MVLSPSLLAAPTLKLGIKLGELGVRCLKGPWTPREAICAL